jgi:DNA-binding GntR family transcriptional regulator
MAVRVPRVKPGGGPAHVQIESWLADAVAGGRLAPGDRLPPERELASRAGVSRMTLRQALDSLERRGVVARQVGRGGGTLVAAPKLELAGLAGLSDQLRAQGRAAGARVLSAEELPASAAVAAELALEPGAPVYELVRVRFADRVRVALEHTTLPADAFPGLLAEPLTGSLYELMRARYDDVPVRAHERLEPVLASAEEAAALGIEVGGPLFRVERTGYGATGRALEWSRDLFRGDRTRVVWESAIHPAP